MNENLKNSIATYFFTTHIFISLIAVFLSLETSILFQHSFLSIDFYLFIFFSTLFSYNVYYIKTEQAKMYWTISIVAFVMMVFFFFKSKLYLDTRVLILATLSIIYIIPVFLPFEKSKNFTTKKFFLLIITWVFCTFYLPLRSVHFNYYFFVLFTFRFSIMTYSCLLFFIRDEQNIKLKNTAQQYCKPIIAFLFLLSLIILFTIEKKLGLINLSISILCIFLNQYFLSNKRTKLDYLIYADGILALQSFLVYIFIY